MNKSKKTFTGAHRIKTFRLGIKTRLKRQAYTDGYEVFFCMVKYRQGFLQNINISQNHRIC